MARTVKEWIGKTDDSKPTRACLLRLFDRACGHCNSCGARIGLKQWEADHIKRLKDGGENRESNLQVLCIPCHRSKTSEENSLQGKANRVRYKTHSIKKPSKRGQWWKPRGAKFDWSKGRYVKETDD